MGSSAPGKAGQPAQPKGGGVNHLAIRAAPVEPDAWRHACPCSTEARGSNTCRRSSESSLRQKESPRSIRWALWARAGATEKNRRLLFCAGTITGVRRTAKAVMTQAGENPACGVEAVDGLGPILLLQRSWQGELPSGDRRNREEAPSGGCSKKTSGE
jgi:hypothetical protein